MITSRNKNIFLLLPKEWVHVLAQFLVRQGQYKGLRDPAGSTPQKPFLVPDAPAHGVSNIYIIEPSTSTCTALSMKERLSLDSGKIQGGTWQQVFLFHQSCSNNESRGKRGRFTQIAAAIQDLTSKNPWCHDWVLWLGWLVLCWGVAAECYGTCCHVCCKTKSIYILYRKYIFFLVWIYIMRCGVYVGLIYHRHFFFRSESPCEDLSIGACCKQRKFRRTAFRTRLCVAQIRISSNLLVDFGNLPEETEILDVTF